jgi:GDP-D-mannose dehydratase
LIKKALIIGPNGPLGRTLTDYLLKKNYFIFQINRYLKKNNKNNKNKKIKLLNFNLEKKGQLNKFLAKNSAMEIYYLASKSLPSFAKENLDFFYDNLNANVFNLVNCLEAIKLSKKNHKFLYTASSRLFEGYKNKRVNEKTPFNYNTYYSLSKDLGLKIVEFYKKNFYLHLSSVILFTIYSKYSDQNFLLPKVINQIKNNQKINVKNANFKIDFIDGQSAVFLLHKIINKKKADNFIISSGTKFLFSKIIKEIAIFFNKNTKMINFKISKKISCKNNYGSNKKILNTLRLRKNYFTLKYIIKNIL